jgi:RNA polymerase sigma factor (sigma-70 family)
MDDLTALIEACQSGELGAYGRLVRRFQNMAYAYACALLGDCHLAEDAAQEAFVEAYERLKSLREPRAFAAWLRRIVLKHCDRQLRTSRVPTTSMEKHPALSSSDSEPSTVAEKRETTNRVLNVVGALPEPQREVITLFYMNEYSQEDIADFLNVPLSTIKNRLYAGRQKLKRSLLDMVTKSLEDSSPDDRFSNRVVARLLARPKLLDIERHPVRLVWDEIRAALADYELIDGDEIEDERVAKNHALDSYAKSYRVNERQVLRTQTTDTLWLAMTGRTPPVRLLTAGRVFRQVRQDKDHTKVFHQADGVCIDPHADAEALKDTVTALLKSLLGNKPTRWRPARLRIVSDPQLAVVKTKTGWLDVVGAGLLKPSTLQQAGYDAKAHAGFAFGLGIEVHPAEARFDS